MMRYLPPNETAGFALSSVSVPRREPRPPARTKARTRGFMLFSPFLINRTDEGNQRAAGRKGTEEGYENEKGTKTERGGFARGLRKVPERRTGQPEQVP